MNTLIDLEAYFRRIGYSGPHAPGVETLTAIHRLHPPAIAFENLDPLLGRPVRLDPESLERKLVHGGRGGYCFEQNLLLSHVLSALGFQVTGLAARVLWNAPEFVDPAAVRWNAPEARIPARGHMLLRVDLHEGPYIADVGFGGLTLTAPLRLLPGTEQATPHERFRLMQSGREFELQAQVRGSWKALYRFDLQPQLLPDYEVSNWYLSTHPTSHFVTGLMAARAEPDRRYALRNHELAVHYLAGSTKRRALTSVAELRAALEGVFKLRMPNDRDLDDALGRLIPQTLRTDVQHAFANSPEADADTGSLQDQLHRTRR